MLQKILSIGIIPPFMLLAQQFTKIESGPAVSDGGDSRSINWVDYDNDGDLDLFITNGPAAGQNNYFYENNGNGTFTKIEDLVITQDKAPSDGSTWGDFNNDGHPDLFVANWYGKNNLLYLNNGDKTFSSLNDTASASGGHSESASWADVNNDAFIDLYVANSDGDLKNFVYINSTKEKFSRQSGFNIADDVGTSRHMDWADYDNDGDLDLFVPNENNEKNFLYQNNGDGTFSKITDGDIVNNRSSSFGSSWGDYDNDGDLDLFVANWSNQNNYLYKNNGDATFTRITEGIIVNDKGYSIGTAWADVDNDGDQDLFVANAFSPSATNNFLYINNGDGTFAKDTSLVSKENGWSYGASFGDYNRDGYLDLAVAKCFNANEDNALYLNNGGNNNWLTLKLSGTVSNRSAIGATAHVKAKIIENDVWQMRQVSSQNGYCGQNLELHFGLADAAQADSIIIKWPSGNQDVLTGVAANQVLVIEETIPEGFLRPHFKAHNKLGFGELDVIFSDLSISNPDIISYAWDFNNDAAVDSEDKNPSWLYDKLGIYTVKLTLSNGSDEQSKTFEDYIHLQRVPGVPVINKYFPSTFDTTILKREEINFRVSAIDTSEYPLSYSWYLDGMLKSNDSTYEYRSSAFGVPRTDSVRVDIFNGYNTSSIIWRVNVVNEITTIETSSDLIPQNFSLQDNFPNPFNPVTHITYTLPRLSKVELSIYHITGEKIKTLVNKQQAAGEYTIRFDANNLASGIYFYTLKAGDFKESKRMAIIK